MIQVLAKHLTQTNLTLFFAFFIEMLLLNWLIKRGAAFLLKKMKIKPASVLIIQSISNWVTVYGIILLFLFFFSHAKWLFRSLYSQNGVNVTPFLIIIAFMIVTLTHRLVKLLLKYVMSSVYHYYRLDQGIGYTFNQIIYYTVMIAALAISLTSVGLNLTALGAILGVLGIGIGFGIRNIAGNFVSGIIMLFERPIEVGDTIQIDDKVGRVEKIRLRSTVIRAGNEGTLIVPNQYFIEQIIKNRSTAEMIASVTVNVPFGTDTDKIFELLKEASEQVKRESKGASPSSEPDIRLIDFTSNGMKFLIEIPVKNFDIKEHMESNLRAIIAKSFMENQILPA